MNAQELQKLMVIEHTGKRTWRLRLRNALIGLFAWAAWLYVVWYFFAFNRVILTQELTHGWYFKHVGNAIFVVCAVQLFALHSWARYTKKHTTTLFVYPFSIALVLFVASHGYAQLEVIKMRDALVANMINLTALLASIAAAGYWFGQIRRQQVVHTKSALIHGLLVGHGTVFVAVMVPQISAYAWFVIYFCISYMMPRFVPQTD